MTGYRSVLTRLVEELLAAMGAADWSNHMAYIPGHLWHGNHRLSRIDMTLRIDPDGELSISAQGRADTKRTPLWSHEEHFRQERNDLSASDWVAHLVLVALQDRPTSAQALQDGLRGEGWEQLPMPF